MKNLEAIKVIIYLKNTELSNQISSLFEQMGADILKIETQNKFKNLKQNNLNLFYQIELSDILITDKTELKYTETSNINPQLVFCLLDIENTIPTQKQGCLTFSLRIVNLILSSLFGRARNGKGQFINILSSDIENLI